MIQEIQVSKSLKIHTYTHTYKQNAVAVEQRKGLYLVSGRKEKFPWKN